MSEEKKNLDVVTLADVFLAVGEVKGEVKVLADRVKRYDANLEIQLKTCQEHQKQTALLQDGAIRRERRISELAQQLEREKETTGKHIIVETATKTTRWSMMQYFIAGIVGLLGVTGTCVSIWAALRAKDTAIAQAAQVRVVHYSLKDAAVKKP